MHDIQNIAFISSIKRTYWTRVISVYSRRNFFRNQSKFQLRNIQFSMLCHIRNTFQTRFSSQENCSVYRDTFATLNYTRYSNFFYPNLFKPLLSGQKRKKRKKISLNEIATRQNNPLCEERRESVGAVN